MQSILITGGLGFVGGRITKRLSFGNKIIVTSRNTVSPETLQKHGNVESILHSELFQTKTFPKKIDTVIHLAALNEWDCIKYPSEAIRVNIDETRIILENSINAGVKNFIFFSTAHIYGSPQTGQITENTLPIPIHPYAITHKAAEYYVIAATHQKKINGIILRLSNSFGAPVSPAVNRWTLLANDLCRQAVEKESLTLLTNGCQYRDFVCLTDVADVVNMIVSDPLKFKKIVYNLGGKTMRVIDLAQQIANKYSLLYGKNISINLPTGSVNTPEPVLQYVSNRLHAEGCSIKNDIQSELRDLLRFCKLNFSRA